jgi:hypothetical protein
MRSAAIVACVCVRGAQAASLQFAAACREHPLAFTLTPTTTIHPAGCRVVQASSLRSSELISHLRLGILDF